MEAVTFGTLTDELNYAEVRRLLAELDRHHGPPRPAEALPPDGVPWEPERPGGLD